MELLIHAGIALAGIMSGLLLQFILNKFSENNKRKTATEIIENAKTKASQLIKDAELTAHTEISQQRAVLTREINCARQELKEAEQRFNNREESLKYRTRQLEKREEQLQQHKLDLEQTERELDRQLVELEESRDTNMRILQEISGFTKEQATKMLLSKLEEEVESETVQIIEKGVVRVRTEAVQRAREILAMALQRCAIEHTSDNVISTIDLPNEEMKGRIIGREGRNIRAFEKITGVDVIVDDTPGVVVVSAFDPIRREIATRSMEKLITDGRIHPGRIEEVVGSTKEEMEEIIVETGKQAVYDLDIYNLHPREIYLLGKLKFQSVMGQNLLQHTMEVVYLTSLMAGELRLNIDLAKRCALLHDIGRATDHNYEGSHAAIGAEIAKRCQEPMEVTNAIAAHHEEVPARSLYSILLQIAHKISAERPGARKEHWERHLKRLERLENLALSFAGVETAYVVQAGREIRCIVDTRNVDDGKAIKLCRNIARKIEKDYVFPGEIRVVVVRETRIVEYAK